MVSIIPLLFAAVIGFTHAFEVDHLVAVSSIVTRRNNVRDAIKDGIYWGLGHTSTILLVGILMIIMRLMITEDTFGYLEAGVGFMLIALGIHRMLKDRVHLHHHGAHSHQHSHRLAYGVGLVHGLAGSGALVLLVMTQIKSSWGKHRYLLIFGIGSIAGMLLASVC